jgi:hypothetical protein
LIWAKQTLDFTLRLVLLSRAYIYDMAENCLASQHKQI